MKKNMHTDRRTADRASVQKRAAPEHAEPIRAKALKRKIKTDSKGVPSEPRLTDLQAQLAQQSDLLNLAHDSILVMGLDDVIRFWNRGAEQRYGWTPEEACGQVTHTLLQTVFPQPLADIRAELLRLGFWEGELVHTTRAGNPIVVASRWALQRDAQGHPTGILEINNDITARKRAEESLREALRQVQSLNQELEQRAQDLETANEELQVANEELRVANEDLQSQAVERRRAEDDLRVSDERFRFVLANSPVVVATTDRELRYTWVYNPASGFQSEDLIGKPVGSGADRADEEKMFALLRNVVAEGTSAQWESASWTNAGTKIFESHAEPLRDGKGHITGAAILSIDITERRHAAESLQETTNALRQSEEKYRKLFMHMTEEVHFWKLVRDAEGHIQTWRLVDANPPTLKTWGRSTVEEIRGKTTDEIFGPGSTEHYLPVVQKIMTEGVPYSFQDYFPNLDKYFRFTSVPLGDYFITTGADITGIVKSQQAVRESEEQFQVLAQNLVSAVALINARGEFSIVNHAFLRLFDLDEQATILNVNSRDWSQWRVFAEDGRLLDVDEHPVRKAARTRMAVTDQLVALQSPGRTELKWLLVSAEPILDGQGQVHRLICTYHDITERKHAEEALRASEERYRGLFEHMVEGYAYCKMIFENGQAQDFVYLSVNAAFETLTGLKEVVGRRVTELIPGIRESDPELFQIYARVALSGQPEKFEMFVAALQMWFAISVYSPEKEHFVAVFDVITARKRAEEKLRELSQRLTYHIENSPLAVIEWGPDMRLTRWSGEAERVFGWKAEEVLGKRMEDFRWIYQDDEQQVEEVSANLQTGANPRRFSANRNYRKDGSVVWCEWYNSSLLDEAGQLRSILSLVLDVTERQRAAESLRDAMHRIQKLNEDLEQRASELEVTNEELERLATALALDLRSPLVSLRGVSRALAQDYGEQLPPQALQLFQLIHADAEEMEGLTQGLLQIMRVTRQTLRKQDLDPAEIVRAAWAELEPQRAKHAAQITVGSLPACRADPLLLKQVWLNLLSNALQATRHQEQARIEIGARQENHRIIYFVKDNGVGFDMSYAGTIFRPFQRYHRPDEWDGSGVGLAIVDSIIRRHGGRVWAEGAVNAGATFYFEV